MPVYSADHQAYIQRVHRNGREPDQAFESNERLFRRYPKAQLLDGKPIPLAMQFEVDSGISVNRGKYSEPQDVLEPDCCNGVVKAECVVLDLRCGDIPAEIATADGTDRVFRFRMAHRPTDHCFAHSEIWCNEDGNIDRQYRMPPKQVKNLFRAALAQHLARRAVLEFPKTGQ